MAWWHSAREFLCNKLVMGKSCCAVGCTARFSKGCGLQFYRFPKDSERRSKWAAAVNRKDWKPTEYSWICSSHFVGGKKSDDPSSPAYIPSMFDHVKYLSKRKAEENLVRYDRIQLQRSKRRRQEALEVERREREEAEMSARILLELSEGNNEQRDEPEGSGHEFQQSHTECGTSTELTQEQIEKMEESNKELLAERDHLKRENALLKEKNVVLSEELVRIKKTVISPESIEGDDNKVKYYTGLPTYKVLKAIFDFVSPSVNTSSRTALPLFNQFLMVLARLRLNMEVQHLMYT